MKEKLWLAAILGLFTASFVGFVIRDDMRTRSKLDRLEQLELQHATVPFPLSEAELEELGPSVLAELPGFDAATQQLMDANNQIADLQFRVKKLETDVRRLNQTVFRVTEIRIGDAPPEPSEGE